MRILDWYILKKFLSTFLFVVLIVTAVIVVVDFTDRNDKFIKYALGAGQIIAYYQAYIPYIINMVMPVLIFIASVFVTARMAAHTEIIAMLSTGVSFVRMMRPYLIGAIIIGAASYYFNGWLIPEANKTRIHFQYEYFDEPQANADHDLHIKVAPDTYAYLQAYHTPSQSGRHFSLERIEGNQLKEKLTAQRIEWDSLSHTWRLLHWQRRSIVGLIETHVAGQRLDTLINLNPGDFGSLTGVQETLTTPALARYINLLQARGDDGISLYKTEQYLRSMSPFAAIILTFMGLIISAKKKRGGTGLQIAIGFGLAFLYIIFFMFAKAIAESNSMPSLLAVWIPNIIFGAITLMMYFSLPK